MPRQYQSGSDRRRQIAEAALDLIASEGLTAFRTRAVAERVGLKDGSLFRHFESKQAIVLAAMDRLEEDLFSTVLTASEDPRERLAAFFRARATLLGGPRGIGQLVFSSQLVHAAGPEGREKYRSWKIRSMSFICEQLEGLAATSGLRVARPVSELARVVLGGLLVFSNERILAEGGIDNLPVRIDQAWQTLSALLFHPPTGLQSPPL